jgi:hypothetical protein
MKEHIVTVSNIALGETKQRREVASPTPGYLLVAFSNSLLRLIHPSLFADSMKTGFGIRWRLLLVVSMLLLLSFFQFADTLLPAVEVIRSARIKPSTRLTKYTPGAVIVALEDRISTTSSITAPDYMKEYFMYDITAKRALVDLYKHLIEHKVDFPIFEDRLNSNSAREDDGPLICLAITTARRRYSPISYLVQAVSAILNRMNYKKYKDKVYVHVFNVDPDPEQHEDVDLIRTILPVTDVKAPIASIDGDFEIHSLHHENMDYALILRLLNSIGCQYPIMVEDDSLATLDWVESILLAIRQLSERETRNDWLVLKLYTARQEYSDKYERGVSEYDMGWNSVANMINREYLLNIADELETTTLDAVRHQDDSWFVIKDHTINKCAKRLNVSFLAFEPVIFQHTGIFSSVRERALDREAVNRWDMTSKRFDGAGYPIQFRRDYWH